MHLYPRTRQARLVLGRGRSFVTDRIMPCIEWMARNYDEIHWEDRLSHWNHCPAFPLNVTGVLDTFPIEIYEPRSFSVAKLFYNVKYEACVVKVQLLSDNLGRFIHISGPHLGVTPDSVIWENTLPSLSLHPEEVFLADGAYVGNIQLLTPTRQPNRAHLEDEDYVFNVFQSFYRARAEHSNCRFTRHGIFQTPFRGSWFNLNNVIHAIGHTQAVDNRLFLKYEPYGPWSHF